MNTTIESSMEWNKQAFNRELYQTKVTKRKRWGKTSPCNRIKVQVFNNRLYYSKRTSVLHSFCVVSQSCAQYYL